MPILGVPQCPLPVFDEMRERTLRTEQETTKVAPLQFGGFLHKSSTEASATSQHRSEDAPLRSSLLPLLGRAQPLKSAESHNSYCRGTALVSKPLMLFSRRAGRPSDSRAACTRMASSFSDGRK
jgi:hypothetical protein